MTKDQQAAAKDSNGNKAANGAGGNAPPNGGAGKSPPTGGNVPPKRTANPGVWTQPAGPVFKFGLGMGLLLTVFGWAALSFFSARHTLEVLIVCCGLGIILGAFGSTMTTDIRFKGAIVGGVGAIAVTLYTLIFPPNQALVIEITGGELRNTRIDLIADEEYSSTFNDIRKAHRLRIIDEQIDNPYLTLVVIKPDNGEISFECISTDIIRKDLQSGKTLRWQFRSAADETGSPKIYEPHMKRYVAERIGGCPEPAEPDRPVFSGGWPSLSLIAVAQAQEFNWGAYSTTLQDLQSQSSLIRRQARTDLAMGGVEIVKPLLEELTKPDISYRTRLGVIVALTEMMRENKAQRQAIMNEIDQAGIIALTQASADEDRTIRIYASEFLYDLGDPRTVEPALSLFPSASANGRYNLLLVVKGAVPHLSKSQKSVVAGQVTRLKSGNTPKTNKLIDSIVALAAIS